MRNGVRLGIDVGKVRIGVAVSDNNGMLATPVVTLQREGDWLSELKSLATSHDVFEIIVGLPLSLSGAHTPSTQDALDVATSIEAALGLCCRMVDERFSTTSALTAIKATGKTHKQSRSFIDQAAAVNILQHALDAEKNTQKPAGILLSEYTS